MSDTARLRISGGGGATVSAVRPARPSIVRGAAAAAGHTAVGRRCSAAQRIGGRGAAVALELGRRGGELLRAPPSTRRR